MRRPAQPRRSAASRVAGIARAALPLLAGFIALGTPHAGTPAGARGAAAPVAPPHLLVVEAGGSAATGAAIAAMRADPRWTLDVGTPDAIGSLDGRTRPQGGGLAVVALGNEAARQVAASATTLPVVDCMIVGDLAARPNHRVVPLAVPAAVQARWLARLLPAARTVAMVYDPALNAQLVAQMTRGFIEAGIAVQSAEVTTPSELPAALTRLASADALIAIPDATVYAPPLAKGLLLWSYRSGTPMIATSDAWVRMGALYALEWDPATLGVYCAAMAAHLAQGGDAATEPRLPAPRVSVNRRAAEQLRLKWSGDTLAGVTTIHD